MLKRYVSLMGIGLMVAAFPVSTRQLFAQVDAEVKSGSDRSQNDPVLKQMRELAESTKILVGSGGDGAPRLIPRPIFRYSDAAREIFDATLWAWTIDQRPVVFQKVESGLYDDGKRLRWTYCLASLSESLIEVKWSNGHRYKSSKPGIEYAAIAGAPRPAANRAVRRRQMKQLASRFSATITHNPDGPVVEEMRLLTRPVMEYSVGGETLPTGAVFGFTSNGTNPDAYLVIDLQQSSRGEFEWRYGATRMTICGIELRLDERSVWKTAWVAPRPIPFDAWTFFYTPRVERGQEVAE